MDFEWDEQKASANVLKHQVTFDEAKTVFDDPLFVYYLDTLHSDTEDRYIILGRSAAKRLLTVCYTERHGKTRLISARKATARERLDYQEG